MHPPGDGGAPVPGVDFVIGPTVPGKWGSPVFGTGATITWSLTPTGTNCDVEFLGCTMTALADFMPTNYLGAIKSAFNAWASVADLVFVQVADNGVPFDDPAAVGDIRIGGHPIDPGVLAHAYYPPVHLDSAAGDIHFDTEDLWQVGFGGPGFDIFWVAVHEIGHAIGLDHALSPGQQMTPMYTEAFAGPQAGDIAGAQFIYGPPHPLPLPGTVMLMGLGVCAMGVARRRSRRLPAAQDRHVWG